MHPFVSLKLLHGGGHITVDTNGKQQPNAAGRDMFKFNYFNSGHVGDSDIDASYSNYSCRSDGTYCLSSLISYGWQMDY